MNISTSIAALFCARAFAKWNRKKLGAKTSDAIIKTSDAVMSSESVEIAMLKPNAVVHIGCHGQLKEVLKLNAMKFILKIGLGFICSLAFYTTAQTPGTTASNLVIKSAKNYQNKALFFREIPQFNRDSTVFYFDKATAVLENSKPVQHQLLAEIYNDIIDRENRSHPFVAVDSLAAKGMGHYNRIPKKNQDILLKYELLRRWSAIKVEKGDLKEAIALFSQALALIQDDNRPAVRAKFLNDKAYFLERYDNTDEKKNAHHYLDESIAIYKKQDPVKYAPEIFRNNQLMLLKYDGLNEDSLQYYLTVLKQDLPQTKNPFKYGWMYSVEGSILIERKKNSEAKQVLLEGKAFLENYKMTNVDSYASIVTSLGELLLEEGKYEDAIELFIKIRRISEENNFKYSGIETLYFISKTYEKQGDYSKALEFYKQYEAENLLLETEKNARSLRENELKIHVMNRDKELSQNKQTQFILILFMFAAGVLLALLYRNYRLKQRNNQTLKVLNSELNAKNGLLDKKVAENELLLKEIHHRVKNNLEIVSSLLELQSSQIDDPSIQAAMLSSQNRVHSMGIIHQKLYQSDHLTSIEMRDYFVNLGENIRNSFDAEGKIKIDCEMPELVLDVDTAISVGLITNELLTNAFKYAFEGKKDGTIKVNLTRKGPNDGNLELRISDNGIGRIIDKNSKGTGFGTMLIYLLTKQLNGSISYQIENGTKVSLVFTKPNTP
ncbi:histidine kinase dimerization/phosphoacceptor domain -containing protein [Maribacter chungangensis]|uniref:histidine kinase n=1 Tax=Maribacter chungangensis TaxID=1069117 RepID=A0ABW3B3S4_9FLAO